MLLDEIIELASYHSGRPATPESHIWADLDINGGDFIEFVEAVERRYNADLSWVSPRLGSGEAARDATVREIAQSVGQQTRR